MRKIHVLASAALVASTLAACTGASATPIASSASPASSASAAGGLTVYYEENAQVELIAPSGRRILIDVWDPSELSSPATAQDILLTSHLHTDHYNAAFEDSFPGQKLTNRAGAIELDDVKVVSLESSHDVSPIVPGDASDHILVIDVGGFRVVHFGDIGQPELSDEQLAAMGRVDLAFLPLRDVAGVGGDIGSSGGYPLALVEQAKPSLLIPTHTASELVEAAVGRWPGTFSSHSSVTIPRDQLPAQTTVLCMGYVAPSFGKLFGLDETEW